MTKTQADRLPLGKQRMEALSDGIYAIALTLLVLDLRVPSLPRDVSERALQKAMLELLPRGLTWLSSFGIMALFWLGQQRLYTFCVSLDSVMLWSELAQLALISLVPFTTALTAAYRWHVTVAVLYGAHLLAMTLCSYLRTAHLLRRPALHSQALSPESAGRLRARAPAGRRRGNHDPAGVHPSGLERDRHVAGRSDTHEDARLTAGRARPPECGVAQPAPACSARPMMPTWLPADG
jgi:uncharacterized membrane protein